MHLARAASQVKAIARKISSHSNSLEDTSPSSIASILLLENPSRKTSLVSVWTNVVSQTASWLEVEAMMQSNRVDLSQKTFNLPNRVAGLAIVTREIAVPSKKVFMRV